MQTAYQLDETDIDSSNFPDTGIPMIGKIAWGTHFCKFYNTQQDFLNSIIPYFKLGLENNEVCVWIQHDDNNLVYPALKNVVPNLDKLISSGKMIFLERQTCFKNASAATAGPLLSNLINMQIKALQEGYNGVRCAGGPTNFCNNYKWEDFASFENCVDQYFYGKRIIALCCYNLSECDAGVMVDIIKTHQFALLYRNGQEEIVENSSLKVLKEVLRKQNRELEKRVRDRTKDLQTALHARDRFLSIASHELKTPITTLKLYTDGIIRTLQTHFSQSDKLYHLLMKVQEQSTYLESLINRLLDITYILKNDHLHLKLENLDLVALIKAVIEHFEGEATFVDCHLILDAPMTLVGCWDPVRLQQIINNLLTNAFKYAPGKPIIISIAKEQNDVILSIQDHGIGIPAKDQERIFERFIQLNDNSPGGFGLGLWLVKQIVAAHHGKIHLKSKPNQGACFTITLPVKIES